MIFSELLKDTCFYKSQHVNAFLGKNDFYSLFLPMWNFNKERHVSAMFLLHRDSVLVLI